MANSIYQGKINRQFWGKLIRQSATINLQKSICLQLVTWGGAVFILKHKRQFRLS